VNHIPGSQAIPPCQHSGTTLAANIGIYLGQSLAFCEKAVASCGVYGSIYATPTQKRRVRRVDDGINVQGGDVDQLG